MIQNVTVTPGVRLRQPVFDYFARISKAYRPMTTLRNAVTALVLSIVALVVTEVWLRGKTLPTIQGVTAQAAISDQVLLIPSATCHHELRRMLNTDLRASARSGSHAFRVNSFGCRGREAEIPATEGTLRILVLGDNSICGTEVDESETVSARLQQFLTKQTTRPLEVVNGGIPGYCPLLAWLKFEQDLAMLKPDVVILHVDMSDVADDLCFRSLLLSENNHAVCSHPTMRLKPKPENALAYFVRESAMANWLFAEARQQGPEMLAMTNAASNANEFAWITDDPSDVRLQIRHALEPITRLKEAVEASGGQLLVTTAPVMWQVVPADAAPELSRQYGIRGTTPFRSRFPFEILQAYCSHIQVRFCDTSPTFSSGKDPSKLFSTETPVLSRVGMALYAREIARYLIINPPSEW